MLMEEQELWQKYLDFLVQKVLVMSPWSDKKVSRRTAHISVALPTAEGT